MDDQELLNSLTDAIKKMKPSEDGCTAFEQALAYCERMIESHGRMFVRQNDLYNKMDALFEKHSKLLDKYYDLVTENRLLKSKLQAHEEEINA